MQLWGSYSIVKKHRGILTVLTLVLLGSMGGAVAVHMLYFRLPDPQTASREGLFRWLLQRDLSHEPRDTQLALVDRFEQEIRSGVPLGDGSAASLSEDQRRRIAANIELLKHVWFVSRVDGFSARESTQRDAYLDAQIATVAGWSAIDAELARQFDAESHTNRDSATTQWFNQIEQWMAEAPQLQRQQMHRAVRQGVARWLATRDIGNDSFQVRQELARRIARDLNQGLRLDQVLHDRSEAEREQLRANGELLMEAWFHDCAKQYSKLPDSDRADYVDGRLEDVANWGVIELLVAPESLSAAGDVNQFAALTQMVETWIQRADPLQQTSLRQLYTAVGRRALTRYLRGSR